MRSSGGWDESARAWINDVSDQGDWSRRHVLDPFLIDLLGEYERQPILDLGCGEGRFARTLTALGFSPVGIDPTRELLEFASQKSGQESYIRGIGESLPLAHSTFGLALSYLSLIDIQDFRRAIRETARILRPGGIFLIANLNDFITASPAGWQRNELGHKTHYAVDNYSEERGDWVEWRGIRIINYHRPASSYFSALLESGFELKGYWLPQAVNAEPLATATYFRAPYFHVMKWQNGLG